MRQLIFLLAALSFGAYAADKDKPLALETKVDIDWGPITSGYAIDLAFVDLTMNAFGEPVFLNSTTSLPDPVVRALSHWRFTKSSNPFKVTVKIPVRRPLDEYYEIRQQWPNLRTAFDLRQAKELGSKLEPKQAARMLAKLPDSEGPNHPRTSLLDFYIRAGVTDAETARKTRRDLISWLIQNDSQNTTLQSPSVIVNMVGEPLADPEASALLVKQWQAAVKQNPQSQNVINGALNLLRVADPAAAVALINGLPSSSHRSNWLGHVYAFAGLGVTTLSLDIGRPVAASSTLPTTDLASSSRKELLSSSDATEVLSGIWTTIRTGKFLSEHHALPAGYAEFCQSLLQHTKDLFPNTSASCDLTQSASEPVMINRIQPQFPHPVNGAIQFSLAISADGHAHYFELERGPFALYDETYKVSHQWLWKPSLLNGVPKAAMIMDNELLFEAGRQ